MANTYFDTAKITAEATAVAVSTVGSSNVGSNSADLEGSLDNLGGNSSVDVSFEYREVGASSWNQTSAITKSATGSYTQTVSGLNSDTDYEFRAFGKGNDSGETSTGSTVTFTTDTAVPVIDDFEDQDFSEYAGDTGNASITTSPVANGSYAAAIADGGNEIRSTTGLDNYPSQGDVWRFYTYIPTDGVPRFYWGVQDSSNYYYLEFDEPNSTLRFIRVDAGVSNELATASITFDTGAYSETEVEWRTNGRHLIEHFDSGGTSLGTIDHTDTTFASGGVGWGEFSTGAFTTNLSSWWKLDSGSGSTATDYEGNDDGTINGATWTTDSKTGGYALDFDNVDDNIDVASVDSDTSFDTNNGITLTAWAKLDERDENQAIYRIDTNETEVILRVGSGNNFEAFYSTNGTTPLVSSSVTLTSGTWYHAAMTVESDNTISIYHNAGLEDSRSDGGTPAQQQDRNTIGSAGTVNYFGGKLDDLRLYDDALTQSEIQTIYDNTK